MKAAKKVKELVVKVEKKVSAKKPSYKTVKLGDEGELVVQLQDFLSKHGSSIKITGKFEIGTLSAVKAFQKKNGLEVTGIVDRKTWTALTKFK